MQKRTQEPKEKLLEELVIDVKSVVKVNKGGRQRRYSAIVVVGDRKGKVGLGIGKANEVPDAIKKAIDALIRRGHSYGKIREALNTISLDSEEFMED